MRRVHGQVKVESLTLDAFERVDGGVRRRTAAEDDRIAQAFEFRHQLAAQPQPVRRLA